MCSFIIEMASDNLTYQPPTPPALHLLLNDFYSDIACCVPQDNCVDIIIRSFYKNVRSLFSTLPNTCATVPVTCTPTVPGPVRHKPHSVRHRPDSCPSSGYPLTVRPPIYKCNQFGLGFFNKQTWEFYLLFILQTVSN